LRLRELDGQFVGHVTATGMRRQGDTVAGAQGVLFQCPKCAIGRARGGRGQHRYIIGAHYILVLFGNPSGVAPAPADAYPKIARWQMSGVNLDDLTTTPSILLPGPGCGWHGYITKGDAHE